MWPLTVRFQGYARFRNYVSYLRRILFIYVVHLTLRRSILIYFYYCLWHLLLLTAGNDIAIDTSQSWRRIYLRALPWICAYSIFLAHHLYFERSVLKSVWPWSDVFFCTSDSETDFSFSIFVTPWPLMKSVTTDCSFSGLCPFRNYVSYFTALSIYLFCSLVITPKHSYLSY